MVTGAGGSIGGELCRQVAALNPQRLLMVERAEGNLFIIEQELNETGLGAIALPLVADILDEGRMEFIFARHKPDVVFHAAAHKHVYMMERQPSVAFRNNVIGTRLLARQASEHKVGTFVFISTDKAVNPTSVMGATKRLAEIQIQAVQAMQREGGTKFIAVRFGNVLGSSGSVIPIFKRQIENGGPVTVTHPDVTRYFMTVAEAVGLVLQSAVLGKGGEIFVLDMKQPVKILDLARQMIELSGFKPGEDIEIKFTGLKPGEKLFEELQHSTEQYEPTDHPRIMRFVSQVAFSESGVGELEGVLHTLEPGELKRRLQVMVPEYTAHLE
jgi:FlaA1/EpsC-like NDP-sugar epimerase